MELLLKVLELSRKIINRDYIRDDWKSILNDIASLYNVDGAFIGFWEENIIKFKYSSFFIEKEYPETQYPELYEIPLKQRKNFYNTLKEKGFINIENYTTYTSALKPWLDIGLKSLLAVIIRSEFNEYGSLHLLSLKEQKRFSNIQIKALKMIADTIASELDKQKYLEQIDKERQKSKKQLEFLSLLDAQLKSTISINLISDALSRIKAMAQANRACLLFASENLYVKINEKTNIGDISDSKSNTIYKMWESNIQTITQAYVRENKHIYFSLFIPVLSKGRTVAVFGFAYKEEPTDELKRELQRLQTTLTHFISIIHTYKYIHAVSSELSETEEGLIQAFVSATEAKDVYTKGHSEHVAFYSRIIAKRLNLDINQQEMIYNAGLLHDIGKIGIPDMILLKPSTLSPFEYEIIKYHPIISYEIIKNIPKFKGIAKCIRHHHEKTDGSGYPDGLKGDNIELGARILAIADIFDALTTERPYRKSITPQEAINILKTEKVDQKILKKVETDLKDSFLQEVPAKHTFVPKQIEKLRKELVNFDFLTGLKRRSYLVKFMDSYIKDKKPFTLFMVDIKSTSYINYKYGREVGDRIIMFVADELKKILKSKALSRVSADSFMFLYMGKNIHNFKNILRRKLKKGIKERMQTKKCVIDKKEANKIIGCYITFACYPEEGETSEELMYICSLKKKKEAYKAYTGAEIYS